MTHYAAGWYPQQDGNLRYYDGLEWTDHFATEPQRAKGDGSDPVTEPSETVEDTAAVAVEPLRDQARLHKNARIALEQNLLAGETVEVVITGLHNQAIVGTNRRAFVYKKGFMAGASFGSELTSWEYRHLIGVQLHTGMLSGAVVLQGPGQAGTSTSYWQSKDSDPLKAPNAIPVARPWDQAQHGVARLRPPEVAD